MKISERLTELRNERHLSQAELANATGLSKSSVGRWEIEESEPTASAIIILCKYFNVTADYLLGITDY